MIVYLDNVYFCRFTLIKSLGVKDKFNSLLYCILYCIMYCVFFCELASLNMDFKSGSEYYFYLFIYFFFSKSF